jgi:two-component system, OmpR family, sensor histidine kinase KdpD
MNLPRIWWTAFRESVESRPRGYALALAVLAVLTAVMLAFRGHLDVLDVLLLYLMAVFTVAISAGSGPAIAVAFLSFLAYNLLFLPPYYTLTVYDATNVFALMAYLMVAIVTSRLVSTVQRRTEQAELEQRRTAMLYELNAALIGDATLESILNTIVERVVHVYGAQRCRILLVGQDGQPEVRAWYPPETGARLDRESLAMAGWTIANRTPGGLGVSRTRVRTPHGVGQAAQHLDVRQKIDVLFVPIATAQRVIGALEIGGRPERGRFTEEDRAMLQSFADQAALALERTRLAEEERRASVLSQSDALKSALLAAVSHDLRTPLAVIKASATAMLDASIEWTTETRNDFLEAINEETDRLTMMVSNLLDLSRIEGGVLKPDRDWYDVGELLHDVRDRVETRAASSGQHLIVQVDPALSLAWFDYVEIAQVLMNLVENAIKYTPAGTTITVGALEVPSAVQFTVSDDGPGIPDHHLARVFEKFHRADPDGAVKGTGIGLAISKGLVEAHGGRIWVESQPGQGTTFRFTIPGQPVDSVPSSERFVEERPR